MSSRRTTLEAPFVRIDINAVCWLGSQPHFVCLDCGSLNQAGSEPNIVQLTGYYKCAGCGRPHKIRALPNPNRN